MCAARAGDCCGAARPDLSGSAQPQRAAPTMSARAARGAALEAATRAAEDSPSATDLSDSEGAAAAAPASAATACCCSGSLLSQRPAHSAHRPSRAWPRGPSGRLPAVVRVRNGRPDLPAGCQRAACRRSAACCWSSVSLPAAGHICSHAVAATRAATSLQCMGGDRGCSGVPGLLGVALGGCRNVVGCQI